MGRVSGSPVGVRFSRTYEVGETSGLDRHGPVGPRDDGDEVRVRGDWDGLEPPALRASPLLSGGVELQGA